MNTFSIKESFKRGWGIWKENKMLLTLVTIAIMILGNLPNPARDVIGTVAFELAFFLISTIIWVGWTKIFLLLERGESASFRDLFIHLRYFWRYFFGSILFTIVAMIGFILLIIPGVYFVLRYQFALMLIVDQDLPILEAFKRSASLTEGVKWKLLGFAGASLLVAILGVLALGVGILVAIPVITLAHVSIYRKLQNREVPAPIAPVVEPVV